MNVGHQVRPRPHRWDGWGGCIPRKELGSAFDLAKEEDSTVAEEGEG
jgi:hypothetical protein